ncbi:hypothetical protein VTO73DRAFT_13976 [Trametes versicolor]
MARMHKNLVLHCDIHPGNVAFTSCLSMAELLAQTPCPPAEMLIPTFIDFEWALVDGHHLRLRCGDTAVCWAFSSDRVLRRAGSYCKADDLVSLAYVILSLALMASPPWFQQLQNSWTVMDQGGELSSETIIATRKRCLQELRRSGEVEGLILDFISYTEQLRPNQTPDYDKWAQRGVYAG